MLLTGNTQRPKSSTERYAGSNPNEAVPRASHHKHSGRPHDRGIEASASEGKTPQSSLHATPKTSPG